MMVTETRWQRPDHPWLDEFEQHPEACFDELITGVALIEPYGLADPLTIVPMLFTPLEEGDPLRAALDQAVAGWLERWRAMPGDQRLDHGMKRYVRSATDALALAQLVPLSATRALLRDKYFEYLQWTSNLILSSSLDPRARLWLALAEEQPDQRLRSRWLRLCDETGRGRLADHYLQIGFLGLRRLSQDEDAALGALVDGLAAWARHLPKEAEARDRFFQKLHFIQWLYTKPGKAAWRQVAADVLSANATRPFAAWWRSDLGPETKAVGPVVEPNVGSVLALVDRLASSKTAALSGDIWRLITERRRWAEWTGDTSLLAKTAGNIGRVAINQDPALTTALATTALEWEPNNPVLWNLWGRALRGHGKAGLAEAVFWEAVRRFPDNEPSRVELGRTLAAAGRYGEAAAVLAQGARQFLDNGEIQVEWARLRAWRGDRDGATAALAAYTRDHPDDPIALNNLGLLLANAGRADEARPLLAQLRTLRAEREARELSAVLTRAEAGVAVPMPAPSYRFAPTMPAGTEDPTEQRPLRQDARATRADHLLNEDAARHVQEQRQEELRRDLDTLVAEAPDNAYARIVWLRRAHPSRDDAVRLEDRFPAAFELRLLVALRRRDADVLTRLHAKAPERAGVLALAEAALGRDENDVLETAGAWLTQSRPSATDLLGTEVWDRTRMRLQLSDQADPGIGADALAELSDQDRATLLTILMDATRLPPDPAIAA